MTLYSHILQNLFSYNGDAYLLITAQIIITQARVLCLIYTYDAQGYAGPKGECVYIRQSTSPCVITNMLHFRHYKNLPKPEFDCLASL